MAIACTVIRSGALRAVVHCGRFVLDAPRILVLSALMTMLGVFTLAGCYLSRTVDQATASDVNNRTFAFTSGAVFHSALTNVSTALAFSNNAQNFTLCSGSNTATGTNRFGSCILTVTTSSYSANAGPQKNDMITLEPCDFDSDTDTLMVSNRSLTATSAAATTTTGTDCSTTTQTMGSQVDGLSFTFASGAVFNSDLLSVLTALAFSNGAKNFTLTSAGTIRGMATGTSSVVVGSCILTVTTGYSTGVGPQKNDVIKLNPCTFNSTSNTLTVTNLSITVTSDRAVIQ